MDAATDDPTSPVSGPEQILMNPAALNALKRHQLVSLSKRYGLKASGKNGDMVERLQYYAASLTNGQIPRASIIAPGTPHHSNADFAPANPVSPIPFTSTEQMDLDDVPPMPDLDFTVTSKLDKKASMMSFASENWDKMSASGASLISPMNGVDEGTVRSWKSARNGEALSDFGPDDIPEQSQTASSRGSVFAFASSLKRSGTRTFRGSRSTSHTSSLNMVAGLGVEGEAEPEEDIESMPIPPSPASTVGIPRRHSRLSLFERPSTLRLCSPTPGNETPRRKKGSDLPFVGSASKLQELKNRRSLAPLRSSTGSEGDHSGLGRKSLPLLNNYTSASLSSIYPPLPGFHADEDAPPVPLIPGHYPISQPLKHQPSETFTFGSPDHAVSSAQFSEAAQAILQQMNEKLPEGARMDGEVLRGNKADMKRMVSVTSGLGGEGGWGLMERFEGKKDRFAAAHEREFSKMSSISTTSFAQTSSRSSRTKPNLPPTTPGQKRKHSAGSTMSEIPSAPNGASLGEDGRRAAKRTRMSPGPNVLGSLRDAGRSVMTLLGDTEGKSPEKKTVAKGQRSRLSMRGTGLRTRLSMFRSSFRRPTLGPRQGEMTAQERSIQLQKSLKRRSIELSKPTSDYLPINPPFSLRPNNRKPRMPSTSAQTVMSTASSKMPQRKPLPDFGGRVASSTSSRPTSSISSLNASGLPGPKSSMSSSMKKQSQADLIRKARPAPAPPIPIEAVLSPPTTAPTVHRTSSTLYASTASSRARMQATVKPLTKSASRPTSMAPPPVPSTSTSMGPPSSFKPNTFATHNRFGTGESRENLFEENFQLPPPPNPSSPATLDPPPGLSKKKATPARFGASSASTSSPLKPAAASKIRHKNSTLSAIKSRGNLKEEVDVQRRKAEIKAKMERRTEEKELREMLGDITGSMS